MKTTAYAVQPIVVRLAGSGRLERLPFPVTGPAAA
jgi:hypothetical protein